MSPIRALDYRQAPIFRSNRPWIARCCRIGTKQQDYQSPHTNSYDLLPIDWEIALKTPERNLDELTTQATEFRREAGAGPQSVRLETPERKFLGYFASARRQSDSLLHSLLLLVSMVLGPDARTQHRLAQVELEQVGEPKPR